MLIKKYVVICILCVGLYFTIEPLTSYACSGGAPLTVAGLIENADYVVKAHIVEEDDANQNMIIQVEQYLVGGHGPEFLLLNRTDPLLVDYINNGRSSGGDCLGLLGRLDRFNSFYGFLERNDDGSYRAVTTLFNTLLYQFADSHSTLEVFIDDGSSDSGVTTENYADRGTGIDVTEQEFVDMIARESGETPSGPDTSYRYPLKSPLLIQTTSGEYMLPIDWQMPISLDSLPFYIMGDARYYIDMPGMKTCNTYECRISPDKLNVAYIKDDNTIVFSHDDYVEGQELLFSSTSDSVAVWNNCSIDIYTTGYPRLGQEWYQIKQVNHISLDTESCEIYHGKAAWTPDGRQLAYNDSDGIWLWDVFTVDSQPSLLLARDPSERLTPNHFSPLGRYLNFTRDGITKHLDVVSGEIIRDGLISPDEKLILTTERSDESETNQACSLLTADCGYSYPLYLDVRDEKTNERIRFYDKPSDIRQIEWINDHTYMLVACVIEEPDLCGVYNMGIDTGIWYVIPVGRGFEFAYNTHEKITAIRKDAHTISIKGTIIDMTQWFDEDIISIEWLPSLFYYD